MSTVLDVKNLKISVSVPSGELQAVRGIDFNVKRGETLGIVGESGCGKSLTCLSVMKLLPKAAHFHADQIMFGSESLLEMSERKMSDIRGNRMSMIFQDPMTSLNPSFTIGNQLEETLRRHKSISRAEAREKTIAMLQKVGIADAGNRLRQYPHQLSGGLRQRVMISMALLCDPSLLIADEPTTALDVTIQAQILSLIAGIQKELDLAVVLITHDLGVIARVADRVAVMYAGKIVEFGPVKDVFEFPRHPYTKGLLDCVPVPGRTVPGEPLGVIPGIVPSLIGKTRGCAFRERCKYSNPECAHNVEHYGLDSGRYYNCNIAPDTDVNVPNNING